MSAVYENMFGEPYRIEPAGTIFDLLATDNEFGTGFETEGSICHEDRAQRIVNCVNLLAGIPDERFQSVLESHIADLLQIRYSLTVTCITEATWTASNSDSELIYSCNRLGAIRNWIDHYRPGETYPELALLDNLKNVTLKG